MINPELINLKKATELDPVSLNIATILLGANADGKLGRLTADELATFIAPYVSAIGSSPFVENTGSPLPNPIDKPTAITFVGIGTFDQTTGDNIVTTEELNVLFWSSSDGVTGTWIIGVEIPINLTDYVLKSEVVNDLTTGGVNVPLSAEQGKVIQQKWSQNFDDEEILLTVPSYDVSLFPTGRQDVASTFSGWGSDNGVRNNIRGIQIYFRTRTTAPTNIKIQVRRTNKTGAILAEKTMPLTVNPSENQVIECMFDYIITNSENSNIYVMYACDQQIDRWGTLDPVTPFPYPTYAKTSYATGGSQTMVFTDTAVLGATNRSSFVNFLIFDSIESNPTDKLITDIINEVPGLASLPDTITKLDSSIQYKIVDDITSDTGDLGLISYEDGTFTGWGMIIGNPSAIEVVILPKVKFTQALYPITQMRFIIRTGHYGGAILKDITIPVSIPINTETEVRITIDKILNPTLSDIWIEAHSDGRMARFGSTENQGTARYSTSPITTNFSTTSTAVADGIGYYIKTAILTQTTIPEPTDEFLESIESKLDIDVFTPTANLLLPSSHYVASGIQSNIYFSNILVTNFVEKALGFKITSPKGSQLEECFRYTTNDADAGTHNIQIDVKYNTDIISSKTAKTIILPTSTGTGKSIKVLAIGDSTIAATGIVGTPNALISTLVDDYSSLLKPTMTFIGTQGTPGKNHEGKGGKKFIDLITPGVSFYRFQVSGVFSPPVYGDIYSDNGSQFALREINLTSGSGSLAFERVSGTNSPNTSGTLTRVSGTGDAAIAFTSYTLDASNGFWNISTGQLDIQNYLTVNGFTMAAKDLVILDFGINDVFQSSYSGLNGLFVSIKNSIDTFISAFRTAVPNINFGICLTVPPTFWQSGFGGQYGNSTGINRTDYIDKYNRLIAFLIENYDSQIMRDNHTYVIPLNMIIDTVHNFPQTNIAPANSRNTGALVTRGVNAVHPDLSGYGQMADLLYSFIKYISSLS